MAPEKAVKTTSLTMSCVWESGEFQTTGHSGPIVTAQFEGLVLVSSPLRHLAFVFVSCTVYFCVAHFIEHRSFRSIIIRHFGPR